VAAVAAARCSGLRGSSCWEICNVQRISGDRQTTGLRVQNGRRVQNCEEEDAQTTGEEGRVELSLLVFNLGVQCYILSMDESISIKTLKTKRLEERHQRNEPTSSGRARYARGRMRRKSWAFLQGARRPTNERI
jgi:hypothetical protein